MFVQVTAKNVGGVFMRHSVYMLCGKLLAELCIITVQRLYLSHMVIDVSNIDANPSLLVLLT